jgi:hypothetical protein
MDALGGTQQTLVKTESSKGKSLPRSQAGAIIGIAIAVLGLSVLRMAHMDRSAVAITLTAGTIAAVGGACYLGINKAISAHTEAKIEAQDRKLRELKEQFDQAINADDLPMAMGMIDQLEAQGEDVHELMKELHERSYNPLVRLTHAVNASKETLISALESYREVSLYLLKKGFELDPVPTLQAGRERLVELQSQQVGRTPPPPFQGFILTW